MNHNNQIIVIAGPTACGKSPVADCLGRIINAEIISADSMQIYKKMNIGTNKISPNDQHVKHWGIDIIDPLEAYSAAKYQKYARECIREIQGRDKPVIMCGGTGFYIRAVIDDYSYTDKPKDNSIRDYYTKYLKNNSKEKLWLELEKIDPNSADIINKNNTIRVIRALELANENKSYADLAKNITNISQLYPAYLYVLNMDRQKLYERINRRVDQMIDRGLVKEVKNLIDSGYKSALTASNAIGYKELIKYLDNEIILEKAVDNIKKATRNYAKRQLSWFRADKRYKWIDCEGKNTEEICNEILDDIKNN